MLHLLKVKNACHLCLLLSGWQKLDNLEQPTPCPLSFHVPSGFSQQAVSQVMTGTVVSAVDQLTLNFCPCHAWWDPPWPQENMSQTGNTKHRVTTVTSTYHCLGSYLDVSRCLEIKPSISNNPCERIVPVHTRKNSNWMTTKILLHVKIRKLNLE